MVVITFAKDTYIEMMLDGRKTTTIRRNWERWLREFEAGHDLHVYLGSRFDPDRHFVGKCEFKEIVVKHGAFFDLADARADGFHSSTALDKALMEHNPEMDYIELLKNKWAIIRLGEWIDGPYWPR